MRILRSTSRGRWLAWPGAALGAALVAVTLVGRTGADFSATAANSGNSFSAAAAFGGTTSIAGNVVKSSAGSTGYATTVAADGPIAYWRFGEATNAASASDASGNGHTATYGANVTRGVVGAVGDDTATSYKSSSNSTSVPHASALNLNGAFSVEMWLKIDGHETSSFSGRIVAGKGSNPSVSGWRVEYNQAGTLTFTRNGTGFSSASGALLAGRYHHVVYAYDGTTTRWYVNGLLSSSATNTFPSTGDTTALTMGAGMFPSNETLNLDEVALYSTGLSATRIDAHHRTGRMMFADTCEQYRVYANVTSGGSPATGVTSVTANMTSLTSGQTAVPLTAGSWTVGGVAYGYRSNGLRAGVVAGSYGYSLTWTDGSGTQTQSGLAATVNNPIAISPQWLTGFEHAIASTGATPDVFSAVTGSVGNSATTFRSGSRGQSVTKVSGTAAYFAKDGFTTTTTLTFAFRFASLPAADVTSLAYLNASATPLYVGYQAATQKLTLRWGSNTAAVSTTTVAAATWYTIDLKLDVSTNPNTAAWRVNAADEATVSLAAAAQTVTDFRFGSAVAADVFQGHFDDVVHSRALTDYPLGPARVLGVRPNGLGTHSNSANFRNDDGSPIDATTPTRLADSAMLNAGSSVYQAAASATSYVELTMGDTTEVCVRGVQALVSQHKAASQANNMKAAVFSGSTERVVWSGDATFVTNPGIKTALVASAAQWTPSELNALVFRIGYSSDINPEPHWNSLLLEYATAG